MDERDFEFAEGLGVVSLFAFGDDHRGLLLVDCRDEAAAQQEQQASVDHQVTDLGSGRLEVTDVGEGQVDDQQGPECEAGRQRDA